MMLTIDGCLNNYIQILIESLTKIIKFKDIKVLFNLKCELKPIILHFTID